MQHKRPALKPPVVLPRANPAGLDACRASANATGFSPAHSGVPVGSPVCCRCGINERCSAALSMSQHSLARRATRLSDSSSDCSISSQLNRPLLQILPLDCARCARYHAPMGWSRVLFRSTPCERTYFKVRSGRSPLRQRRTARAWHLGCSRRSHQRSAPWLSIDLVNFP